MSMTATRSIRGMMHCSLNFGGSHADYLGVNATAQVSAASISGPKLDNRRVLAALVDLGIVVAGALVILFAADALSGDSGEIRGALGAVILGWALYYHFAMESGDGQTVGKRLMNLRVVLADGRPAGMREIAVRTVLRVVDGIGGYIVGLIVMLATGQRRQRLGDLAAGTIVVDASATSSYVPPAPAFAPVEDEAVEDEAVEDKAVEDALVENAPVKSITLPSRPAAPATLADLAAPEAPPVPEMRPFDPPVVEDVEVAEEPVEDEVVVEPVEDEPVAVLEVAAEPLPEVSTPSLEELAHDVVAAQAEPVPVAAVEVVEVDEPVEDEVVAEDPVEDEPVEDEPMTLKSVETVSAIDLVMGAAPDEDASEQDQAPEGPIAS
jgi:uncharacterized RDD family membrane protein YckC